MIENQLQRPSRENIASRAAEFRNRISYTVQLPSGVIRTIGEFGNRNGDFQNMTVVKGAGGPVMVEFAVTGEDIDMIASGIAPDTLGIDEEGYEIYVSKEEEHEHVRRAVGFQKLLHAYMSAGGSKKPEIVSKVKSFLFQYCHFPDGSSIVDAHDIAMIPTRSVPRTKLLYQS